MTTVSSTEYDIWIKWLEATKDTPEAQKPKYEKWKRKYIQKQHEERNRANKPPELAITGNTFQFKRLLKEKGCYWNGKYWMAPNEQVQEEMFELIFQAEPDDYYATEEGDRKRSVATSIRTSIAKTKRNS